MRNQDNCKIVKDLLPNYIEKLTSEQTNRFIEEHIANCASCKKSLEDMKCEIPLEEIDEEEFDYLKKIKIKSNLNIVWGILIAILVVFAIYLGIVLYRFGLLQTLQNKFKEYENVDNIFLEVNSTSFQNDVHIAAYNAKYWYKEGLLKVETTSWKDENKSIIFIDYNKKIEYWINDVDKTVSIYRDEDISKEYENGKILENVFRVNYYSFPTSLKFSCNVMAFPIKKEKDCIITNIVNYNSYDANTGLLRTSYSEDYIGNSSFSTYNYDFGNVEDKDLEVPNLAEYKVLE